MPDGWKAHNLTKKMISLDLNHIQKQVQDEIGSPAPVVIVSPQKTSSTVSHLPQAPATNQVMRVWFNTLVEFSNGQAKVIKSYTVVAKDSQVRKWNKPKKKKVKAKPLAEVKMKKMEEY